MLQFQELRRGPARRHVLAALPGVELVELPRTLSLSWLCSSSEQSITMVTSTAIGVFMGVDLLLSALLRPAGHGARRLAAVYGLSGPGADYMYTCRCGRRRWRPWPTRLAKAETAVLDANAVDVERAEATGTSAALVDRLRLNPDRIAGMVDGLRDLAALPDPVGDVVRGWTNANGVQVRQVRVPFGVVGIIYEARPNVTADAGGICLKSGNAALLRGSSSAADSNAAIVEALRAGLADAGLPADAIQLVPGPREVTTELMAARGLVDVLIPRGGAGLIDSVVREQPGAGDRDRRRQLPPLRRRQRRPADGAGHPAQRQDAAAVGVQRRRDPAGARRRGGRPSCPRRLRALARPGSRCTGTPGWHAYGAVRAGRGDRLRRRSTCRWTSPPSVVDTLDDALHHIRRYSTGHSETIVTDSQRRRSGSSPRSTPPRCWSTRRAGSSTAVSSASAPRSGSPPRSCTPADRWGCPR